MQNLFKGKNARTTCKNMEKEKTYVNDFSVLSIDDMKTQQYLHNMPKGLRLY